MAFTSEIVDDAPDEEEGLTAMEEPKEEPRGGSSQGPPVEEPSKMDSSSAGQTLYKECALRVAYIMRSYLLTRQVGTPGHGQPPAPPPREGRCKAMMVVVRKEHGTGGGQGAVLAPAVGTEFESVEAGRTFYYGYGEKLGFKARTGSNRRSAGGGALIMQRFLCWRGTHLIYRRSSFSRVGKQKRGPYKKRAHRLVQEVAAAKLRKIGMLRRLSKLRAQLRRYTEEERRDIILKYLMKRTNRAGIKRPTKVPSRQALVGKHRRGIGGQFLSTDELQLEEILIADHNHQLTAPLDIQMLRSQRLSAKFQTGGRQGARQIPASYKNYLRSKRVKNMQSGDADDFGRCMYDFEEEQEFLSVWEGMLVKYDLKDNEWLAKAAENAETYAFMEIQSDQLLEQVESILYAKLLEKPASKGQPQNLVQDGSNNGGSHGLSGKRKKNEHEAEVPVGIDGGPLSADVASNGRNPPQFFVPTQFIQGSFVSAHQFGLNGVQGFHGIAHFNQKSSATTLQQPFHNSSQLSQVLFASQFNGEELHLECSVEVLLGNALENGYNHGKEIQKD
ncbi:FAR1 DNA-binding domain [Musa troglodytarum]|nr:FAR1 DNA-binding domain [Musa troglodytarum]